MTTREKIFHQLALHYQATYSNCWPIEHCFYGFMAVLKHFRKCNYYFKSNQSSAQQKSNFYEPLVSKFLDWLEKRSFEEIYLYFCYILLKKFFLSVPKGSQSVSKSAHECFTSFLGVLGVPQKCTIVQCALSAISMQYYLKKIVYHDHQTVIRRYFRNLDIPRVACFVFGLKCKVSGFTIPH